MYDEVIESLRTAYDNMASYRDGRPPSQWKAADRARFLELLQREGKQSLLEIGAGPGHNGLFFQEQGLDVVCTDLSPEMVKLCQTKGLSAFVMDFQNLDFAEASFDSVYALNCLLHVPKRDLLPILGRIRALLAPRGLFYVGLHGGIEFEGIWSDDDHVPKRFFSLNTDDELRRTCALHFEETSFKRINHDDQSDLHFQSLILRRPE